MKLAIIDFDGVVADATARFAQAEEVKQAWLDKARSILLSTNAVDEREATNLYWRTVFDPANVSMDTEIDGASEAIYQLVEEHDYTIVFLTSRPETMRQATISWLSDLTGEDNDPVYGLERVFMKAAAFQYVKTVVWKAGMVQTLATFFGASQVLVVDDEQANLNEIVKHATVPPQVPGLMIAKSLVEAIAKLNGTWIEPDPFLPEE